MRRDILLPALALIGGGAGFGLRYWQISTAFDEATQLMNPGGAGAALIALFLAVGAAVACLARGGHTPKDYRQGFYCPSAGYMTVMTAGSFLLLAAAGLGALEARDRMALWRMGAGELPVMLMLTAALCLPGAASGLLLGRGNYRDALPEYYPMLATLPAYMALPWLVSLYQTHSRQPELWLYAIPLLGVVCAALGFYGAASFAFGRPRPKMCLFFSLMAAALLLASLADRPGRFFTVMSLACVLLLLGQSMALLRNLFGPPWPEPSREEGRGEAEGETSV